MPGCTACSDDVLHVAIPAFELHVCSHSPTLAMGLGCTCRGGKLRRPAPVLHDAAARAPAQGHAAPYRDSQRRPCPFWPGPWADPRSIHKALYHHAPKVCQRSRDSTDVMPLQQETVPPSSVGFCTSAHPNACRKHTSPYVHKRAARVRELKTCMCKLSFAPLQVAHRLQKAAWARP